LKNYWDQISESLLQAFPPNRVRWRVQSLNKDKTRGMALAYIDARDVMERLDDVVGAGNWTSSQQDNGPVCVATISIWCPIKETWVHKQDAAGSTKVEADKGRHSDAFKRAAVKWGIGRYLYALETPWVEVETRGRSSVISPKERARLAKLLGAKEESMQIDSDIEPPDLYNQEESAPSEFEVPSQEQSTPAPKTNGDGITESQARRLLAVCRTHGEEYKVHGFQVFQSVCKDLGKPVVPGRGRMPEFVAHAQEHIAKNEFEMFEEKIYQFDG
tara:strand:+ start:6051 stop:6869 length:819 start_codon:yes stop_codon:yes gene_type:complete